jgi:DNA-binding transcriptional ArsR family regulator
MEDLKKKEISKIRNKLKKNSVDNLLMQKPFADGMYRFGMFIIDYYSRVREQLEIDYESFMIVQVTVSHQLYSLSKKKILFNNKSYKSVETEFDKLIELNHDIYDVFQHDLKNKNRLTISSICLVLGLPKETVRRKVSVLTKKNLLCVSKKNGVCLGHSYKKVFQTFVPKTVYEMSRLLKVWKKSGALNHLLNFEI